MTQAEQYRKYPAGTILLMEEGEYSDFGYCAHLVTLKECDIPALVEQFKDQHKAADEWGEPGPSEFCAWLVSTQACAPLECQTLHIGSYGRLET